MLRTIHAIIGTKNDITLLEKVTLPAGHHALVTIIDDDQGSKNESSLNETAFLSEKALSDWLNPEEDKAWANL